jgi:hypothetical protein
MRIKLEEGDSEFVRPGTRLKQASLKLLNKEMSLGLTVVSVYPGNQAGIRIIAIDEENKIWIKQCIRVLMKQILNLHDPAIDDQIEKDEDQKQNKPK